MLMLRGKEATAAEAFTMVKSGRRKAAYAAFYDAAKDNPEKFLQYGDFAMDEDARAVYDAMWLRLAKEGLV